MNPLDFFLQIGTPIKLPKGEIVSKQGEVDSNLYLIKTGLLKAIYLRDDGKELIKSFLMEGDIIGSLRSCIACEPCPFQIVCLESTELIRLPYSSFSELIKKNSEIAQFAIQFLVQLSMKKERREFEFLCLSAEKRYQLFVEHNPGLLNRVTQNDISKYLGITPVALSRIRGRSQSKL